MNNPTSNDGGDGRSAGAPPTTRRGSAARVRVALFLVILVMLGFWAWNWGTQALVQVHETDARITADLISISSRVAGRLIERSVGSGSMVTKGEALARIDAREATTELTRLEAELARMGAERAELSAQILMVEERTRSALLSTRANLEASLAMVKVREHERDYASRELERSKTLFANEVASLRNVDEADTVYLKSLQELTRANADVSTARARILAARAALHEVQVLEAERDTLAFRKDELLARLERQRFDLGDHTVESPVDGVVSRAFVDPGEFVQPGQRIALIHDPASVYVEANIRETDIRRVKVGQHVDVEVDAYPDQVFDGRVERIGYAATSTFALLPSPNPSGNFTKVTQRLPVRIALEQRDGQFRPGMMVEVFIHVGH